MVSNQLKMLAPFVAAIVALTLVVLNMDNTLRRTNEQQKAHAEVLQAVKIIQSGVYQANQDINFLAELQTSKRLLNDPSDEARASFADIVHQLMSSRPDYYQVRLLDINGMERFKVEVDNHLIKVVPDAELQDKSDRYYYQDALNLSPRQIYQSPLDLNIEHGKIEDPHRPMLRFVRKLTDKGSDIGLLIINFNMATVFSQLSTLDSGKRLSIVNKDGYFLFGPDESLNWGFMFDAKERNMAVVTPHLWQYLGQLGEVQSSLDIAQQYYAINKLCADESCANGTNRMLLLPNAAPDLPWFVVAEVPHVAWYNFAWVGSKWPYLLVLFVTLSFFLVYRINSRLGQSTDNLNQKTAQLEASNRRFKKLIESIPDGLIILGNDKKIETVNDAILNILGLTDTQLLGNPIEVIMSGHFKEQHYARTDSFYAQPRRIEVTRERPYIYHHPNGSQRFLQAIISPLVFDNDVIAIVLVKDVTNSIKQEEQIRQAQKLDALGQLTGGVAHDFNNLLAIMMGNLELLEMQVSDDEKLIQRIHKITHSVNTAADLTQKLLTVSRRKALSNERVNINTFMQEALDMLTRTIKQQKVTIKCAVAENLPDVLIDPHELTNALINLAVNARDAMPDGGTIFIQVDEVTLDRDYVKSLTESVTEGRYVLINFEDTGQGIPHHLIEKVLEPFFTTKPKGKGTGLGLAMIYGFVKQSKGHMRIYSEPNKGTNIHIYLPAIDSSNIDPINPTVSPSSETPTLTGYRALVVDDEVDLAEVAAAYLELVGMKVDVCHSADQAWQMVQQDHYHIVFSDIVMPGEMDGIDLFKAIAAAQTDTKVVLASGFSQEMLVQQYQLESKLVFIRKPYKRQDMLNVIAKVLQ